MDGFGNPEGLMGGKRSGIAPRRMEQSVHPPPAEAERAALRGHW